MSAGGLYDGLALLIDDETLTYWNHITGEALHGELRGTMLDTWPIGILKAGEVVDPDALWMHDSDQLTMRAQLFAQTAGRSILGGRGILPPGFRGTMAKTDPRVGELAAGIGVVGERSQRFYPLDGLPETDIFEGQNLRLTLDGGPHATWVDGGRPMQLFCRWYGFSLTFPRTEVFER